MDGRDLHAVTPAPGGFYVPPDRPDHVITVTEGSAYSVSGYNTGLPAKLLNSDHYPVEAICRTCSGVIRCEQMYLADWEHTGRKAGQP